MEGIEAILRDIEEKAHARGLKTVSDAREGNAAEVLCSVAEDHEVDVLVVGKRGCTASSWGASPTACPTGRPAR